MNETQTQFLLDTVHILAIVYHYFKTEECTYILLKHHFMNTKSLRKLLVLKGHPQGVHFNRKVNKMCYQM
jgi:hypothetical protein